MEEFLRRSVDVATEKELKERIREEVLQQAISL
jgi:predicted nucleotidyltransferase